MTWNEFVFGGLQGTPGDGSTTTDFDSLISTPNGTQRHIDLTSADIYYWFAGAHSSNPILGQGGLIYNLGRNMTPDEAARGSNYGDMIDAELARSRPAIFLRRSPPSLRTAARGARTPPPQPISPRPS